MDLSNVQVGDTLFKINREMVRAGRGPTKLKVAELVYMTQLGVRSACGVRTANADLYVGIDSLFPTLDEAKAEGRLIARAEYRLEQGRYAQILERLHKSNKACGGFNT